MDFSYEINRRLAILSVSEKGWTKELNIIVWNGKDWRYDIRDWSPDRQKMSKGISMGINEIETLRDALNEEFSEEE